MNQVKLALEKITDLTKYYAISFSGAVLFWFALMVMNAEFVDLIFFLTAYVWHFALLAPGLKEKILSGELNKGQKYSFLSIIIRINHYLQLFINLKKFPYASAFIRALSPLLFTLLLLISGGGGNLIFTVLGSTVFEIIYILTKSSFKNKANPSLQISDPEIQPEIPSVEKVRE